MPPYVVVHTNIIFFFSFFQKFTALQGQRSDNFEILFAQIILWEYREILNFTDLDSSEFAARQLVGILRLKYHLDNTNFTEDNTFKNFSWPLLASQ